MKPNRNKYFGEGLLIVFSVLFALFINKMFDDLQIKKKKNIAIDSIAGELYRNEAILKNWKKKHIEVRDRISKMIEGENDSLKTELRKYNFLNMGVLTDNESLFDALLTNTAWESAKATGIISEFDFETTQKLTHVYSLQDVITNRTITKIVDYYFDPNSHKLENLESILIQFQLRFWELTGQEDLMSNFYKEAIEHLKK